MRAYQAPWWLPGGNLQTIWAALRAHRFKNVPPIFHRERWITPDHDFVDVDWLVPQISQLTIPEPLLSVDKQPQPLLVVFHGLEGSSNSHYAQAFSDVANRHGWACAIPHFRGCSGEINLAPRAYHSGDFVEIDWFLRRFSSLHSGPVMAVGISLGGNALMRWAGEMGSQAKQVVAAIASVCAPLDLMASGQAMGHGFNHLIYTQMFLYSMRSKALQKLAQYPGLFSVEALSAVRDLRMFDDVFIAPLHGFKGVDDYWLRASAKPHLRQIAVPTLLLNACNDSFVPVASLPQFSDVSACVTLWQPKQGGHVGFPSASKFGFPGHVQAMPEAVLTFLAAQL